MTIRYDEIKKGDIINFHGANERVTSIRTMPNVGESKKYYPNEILVYFQLEPADEEATKILGKFYSHGEYGGVGCLPIELLERAV